MKRNMLPVLGTALILAVSASGLLFGEQGKDGGGKKWRPDKGPPKMELICHALNDGTGVLVPVMTKAAYAVHTEHGDCSVYRITKDTRAGDSCDCGVYDQPK